MSYARFGQDSDVYVYARTAVRASFEYVCAHPPPDGEHVRATPVEMLEHLKAHRQAGDKVPDYALARLKEEQEEVERCSRSTRS